MDFLCFHCNAPLSFSENKLPFRASCDHCSYDLHVCKNCKYYSPGQPNDCRVPNTEPIYDREKANLCEEFALREEESPSVHNTIDDIEKKLFGSSDDEKQDKTPFEDIFKDS